MELKIKQDKYYYIYKAYVKKSRTIVRIKYNYFTDFDIPVYISAVGSYRFVKTHHKVKFDEIIGMAFIRNNEDKLSLRIDVTKLKPDISSRFDNDYEVYINNSIDSFYSCIQFK